MKKNNKTAGKNMLTTLAIIILGTAVFCGLIGMMISNLIVPSQLGGVAAQGLTEGLVLLCCYVMARKLQQSRLVASMIVSAVFMLLRVIAGLVLFPKGEVNLLGCAVTLVAGAAAGLLSSMKKQRRR